MNRIRHLLPATDRGRALLLGLVLVAVGLCIGLPPINLLGPGAALAVPGVLFLFLVFTTPPEADA